MRCYNRLAIFITLLETNASSYLYKLPYFSEIKQNIEQKSQALHFEGQFPGNSELSKRSRAIKFVIRLNIRTQFSK
jgi:hypothetical protein